MGIELKTVNPVVFDDLDYCGDLLDQDKCRWLKYDSWLVDYTCDLFSVGELPLKNNKYSKCGECKEHWIKAKREEQTDKIAIDSYLYDCLNQKLYVNGNIIATLVCDDQERLEFVMKFKQPNQSSISTHDGLFNHVGKVLATGMNVSGDRVHIEIMIVITGAG